MCNYWILLGGVMLGLAGRQVVAIVLPHIQKPDSFSDEQGDGPPNS